jgi:hypothetical protein
MMRKKPVNKMTFSKKEVFLKCQILISTDLNWLMIERNMSVRTKQLDGAYLMQDN